MRSVLGGGGVSEQVSEEKVGHNEFEEMQEFVKSHLEDTVKADGNRMRWYPWHSADYRFNHIMSVVNLSNRIARNEGADVDVVRVAALFHDVAKFEVKQEKHAEEGAWIAQKKLNRMGYDDEFIDKVAKVIKDHTNRPDEEMPLESKALIEADSIEKIGVAGATLMALRVGYESRPHDEVSNMMQRVINRGENMLEWMETDTAREIVRKRIERVKTLKNWYIDELTHQSSS